MPYLRDLGDISFQQDNATACCYRILTYLDAESPPSSSDLSPIEYIWPQIAKTLSGYRSTPNTTDEAAGNGLPASIIQAHFNSLPTELQPFQLLKAAAVRTNFKP
ncbi:hypothetical protein TNCV_5023691 [Trichonephila clavipes]|nr:hypothetical protein TNCV_5023691 [Trichonephila clavipes]